MYYDLHTHKIPEGNGDIFTVVNIPLDAVKESCSNISYSIGIHPWNMSKENLQKELHLIEKYATYPNVKILGECGLDKLCKTDFELQKEAFSSQILISERNNKPLLIHCVKSFDEMILFKKKYSPGQAWIIHGFRGKPQQAKQLVDNDFFLSFGLDYNEDTIKNIPIKRIFFETDDSGSDIRLVYKKAATALEISEERLVEEIEENIGRLKHIGT